MKILENMVKFAKRNLGEATFDVAEKHVTESAKSDARETRKGAMGGIIDKALNLYGTGPATPPSPENPSAVAPHQQRSRMDRKGYDPSKEGKPVSK